MTKPEKRKQIAIDDFFSKSRTAKKVKVMENGVLMSKVEESESKEEANDEKINYLNVAAGCGNESFKNGLSKDLLPILELEINSIEKTWFDHLQNEFKKPYFVDLKSFVTKEEQSQTIFPPPNDIYSWSRLTPFDKVKVVIIGQDPYHNHNQAHGLAFSVKPPTPAPPSLKNIYKELKNNYNDFVVDNRVGDLTSWALQGVLLLNTSLTVRAHNANSHSKKGWEEFTKRVVEVLIKDREEKKEPLVLLLWGNNAIKLVESIMKGSHGKNKNIKIFKSVHPSPLSASRGFYGNDHFKKINDWLFNERNESMIDWSVVPGSSLQGIKKISKTE